MANQNIDMYCKKIVAYICIFIIFTLWTVGFFNFVAFVFSQKENNVLLQFCASAIMSVFIIIILQILPIIFFKIYQSIKTGQTIITMLLMIALITMMFLIWSIGTTISSFVINHILEFPKMVYFVLLFIAYLFPYMCLCFTITKFWIKSYNDQHVRVRPFSNIEVSS